MEFSNRNMYYSGYIVADTQLWLGREKYTILPKINDRWHTLNKGETIDKISFDKYATSEYWWVICDANGISNPLDLSDFIGTNILIPEINNLEEHIENSRINTLKNYQSGERILNLEPQEGFSVGNVNLKILEEGIFQGQILADTGRFHSDEFDNTHN